MKPLRSISSSPGWDTSPSQVTPLQFVRIYQQFAGTRLYTWVERGTVRVKCLAQEHNTMSPVRARAQTARSGVERTSHEATAPSIITMGLPKSWELLHLFLKLEKRIFISCCGHRRLEYRSHAILVEVWHLFKNYKWGWNLKNRFCNIQSFLVKRTYTLLISN